MLNVEFGASFVIRYVTFIPGGIWFDTEIPIQQRIYYNMECQWSFCFNNGFSFPFTFNRCGSACIAWTGLTAYNPMLYETKNNLSVLIGFDINLVVFPPSMKMMEYKIAEFFPGILFM